MKQRFFIFKTLFWRTDDKVLKNQDEQGFEDEKQSFVVKKLNFNLKNFVFKTTVDETSFF